MLHRAAASLWRRPAALFRRLPTSAAPALLRHPENRKKASLAPLATAGARGYTRMARRIPPARPEGYSTSDGEADEPDADDEEALDSGADDEEGAALGKDWDGFTLDFDSGEDDEENETEEGK